MCYTYIWFDVIFLQLRLRPFQQYVIVGGLSLTKNDILFQKMTKMKHAFFVATSIDFNNHPPTGFSWSYVQYKWCFSFRINFYNLLKV